MRKLWMTLSVLLLNTLPLYAGVEVNLERSVTVNTEYLKLADIATVTGDGADRLKKVFLGPSPRTGTSMTVLRSDILDRLKGMGLGRNVDFTGSLGVSVRKEAAFCTPAGADNEVNNNRFEAVGRRKKDSPVLKAADNDSYLMKAKQAAAGDLIRTAVKEFVSGKIDSDMPVIMQTTVNRMNVDGNIGDTAVVEGIERGKLPGRATLAIVFSEESQIVGYASVDVTIKLDVETLVLARSVRKGDIVRVQDLQVTTVSYKPGMFVENLRPEDISGRMALKSVRSGVPLSTAYFGKPLDVEKGQMVTVMVKGRGFSIKEMALALASGNAGETIKVESVVNNSVYPVRITGKNQADMPISTL